MALDFGITAGNVLRYLKGDNLVSDIDAGFQALAEDVASKMLGYSEDTLAKRPSAAVVNRLFRATDTGVLYRDTGSVWLVIPSASGPSFLSWGSIESGGGIAAGSGDYTVAKSATGTYVVTWTKAKASAKYAVTATPEGTSAGTREVIAGETTKGTGSFTVTTRRAESALDWAFDFVVLAAS